MACWSPDTPRRRTTKPTRIQIRTAWEWLDRPGMAIEDLIAAVIDHYEGCISQAEVLAALEPQEGDPA
ncbi:hypothetical protein [Methylobacterium ajmalii]|uniref:hypothetical protein n=1 Tax=Methylobacterium ajmalii TaxID=2738439 RepID=UPI002F3524FF